MPKILPSFKARLTRCAMYRRALTDLNRLSDREAGELGLRRKDFARIARDATYGTTAPKD